MQPSIKQLEAIFKMEEYAGVKSHRENFASQEEFQAYWDLLDQKIKKRKSFREAIKSGRVSLVKVRQKRAQDIINYYQNFEHLRLYGEKYYQKYLPSSSKLKKQLESKCKETIIVEKVIKSLTPIINDTKISNSIAQKLATKGKNTFQIKSELLKKMFAKDIVNNSLNLISNNMVMKIENSPLISKIKSLHKKGKSKREILQKFKNSLYDPKEITRVIEENSVEQTEVDILKIEIEKLIRKKVDKNKLIKRLLSKGFVYQDIKKILSELEK